MCLRIELMEGLSCGCKTPNIVPSSVSLWGWCGPSFFYLKCSPLAFWVHIAPFFTISFWDDNITLHCTFKTWGIWIDEELTESFFTLKMTGNPFFIRFFNFLELGLELTLGKHSTTGLSPQHPILLPLRQGLPQPGLDWLTRCLSRTSVCSLLHQPPR